MSGAGDTSSDHVLRRLVLRSLVPAGILLACFAHLVWNGLRAEKTVAENLPHPPLSSYQRDVDLWHSTESFGHVYDLTFKWPEERLWSVPPGSRLQVQLSSAGRTRLLVVRDGHPNDGVSWRDVLTGRVRLQVVRDRAWVDLGPFPASGAQLDRQVYGLLPGPFGFTVQNGPSTMHFSAFRIRRPDSPRARPSTTILRYRFQISEPVSAPETLARFFFFVAHSRVLQLSGLVALALLFAGWWWLWEGRFTRAVAALVPAVTLLHACCSAPFQGADEIAHIATVETLLFNPAAFKGPMSFPVSLARVHAAIGYDWFARDPETPLPIDTSEGRSAIAATLGARLAGEAATAGPPTVDGRALDPRTRAVLYYNAYRVAGPLLRSLSVLDRVEAYVVLSACASLLLFVAGLLFLSRSGVAPSIQLAYGLVALVPYSIGVVASCSNYSLAIGMGQLLSATLVVGVLTDSFRHRLKAAALFTGVSAVGIAVWDDFVFFAVPSALVLAVLAAQAVARQPSGTRRHLLAGVLVALAVLGAGALAAALATGAIKHAVSSFAARVPQLGGFEDPSLWLLLAVAAVPIVGSLVFALAIARSGAISERARRRAAVARSALLATGVVVMFLATRWRGVLFENARLDYPDEVAAHWVAFWSNNLAFDQDVLSWKMYWGVFGYAVSYPDLVYALARWACVALFLALPVLSWRFTRRDPGRSAALLLATGYALTACVVSNSLRYFAPTNPWGRFLLPALPLAALPLLVRAAEPGRERALRWGVSALVALHLWTAIALLGSRYAVGL